MAQAGVQMVDEVLGLVKEGDSPSDLVTVAVIPGP